VTCESCNNWVIPPLEERPEPVLSINYLKKCEYVPVLYFEEEKINSPEYFLTMFYGSKNSCEWLPLIGAPGVDLNKKPNWPLGHWNFKKKLYTKFINKQFNFTGKMYDSKKTQPKKRPELPKSCSDFEIFFRSYFLARSKR
jgi:hypothetical protein